MKLSKSTAVGAYTETVMATKDKNRNPEILQIFKTQTAELCIKKQKHDGGE